MMSKKRPIFNLDEEEQKLSDEVDRGEWSTVENLDKEIAVAKKAASNYLSKKARVNIRMPESDLQRIKQIAALEGLPYQTLMASVLHKYSTGYLAD